LNRQAVVLAFSGHRQREDVEHAADEKGGGTALCLGDAAALPRSKLMRS
jgi:hypothetical protein